MAEEPTKPEEKEEKPLEETKYSQKKHRNASIRDIAIEEGEERKRLRASAQKLKEELANEKPQQETERAEEKPEDAGKEPEKAEEKTPEPAPSKPEDKAEPPAPPKPDIDPEKLAREAAEKAVESYKDELKKIDDSKTSEAKKEARREELKAKWSGVDPKTGQSVPVTYDEIVEESRRIAREDLQEELDRREAARTKAAEERTAQEKAQQERVQQVNQANLEYVNRRVVEERDRMYQNGALQRPKDPNDESDPVVVRERALFAKALEINTDRQKKGQEPISSIADIYYNYFLPNEKSKQPAGADAPVSGTATTSAPPSEDRYNYARDHGKGLREIAADIKRQAQQLLKR